ncbi:hypothetical protein FIBSPDRAFT_353346 [Athelia psychrophila]|uniref:WW domain-containing protein n=1 Tax=Athelia psychrophila TaxID=1759441 RepID=A0A166PQZ4_9AGAM|nr:hypothetical protein FIBSPDRAFT_353346 [Fibularhizoctonia sp. CBS 109695]
MSVGRQLHAAGTSAISVLPISTHGLQMVTAGPGTPISQRPASPMLPHPTSWSSQKSGPPAEPIKISSPIPPPRQLTPPPIATPGGTPSRSGSPKNGPSILPMSTSTVQRWKRGVKVSTEFNHCLVGPYNFEFKDNPPPEGWAACHHPEGALYFFHAEKRVFTDVFMHDPAKAAMVNEAASRILNHIHRDGLDEEVLPEDCDLVIELVERGSETVVGYYFADHASRLLFWMEEFDAWIICREITCVVSFSHLRLEIESQYWTHYELYPNCRGYTTELRDEVRGLLLHAATDQITSVTSTALWTKEENLALLTIIEKLQVDHPTNQVCAGAIVGRVMRNLKHMQFIMLYGQYGARLDCDQSVHGIVVHSHSWYLKSIEPFLFWGAAVHLVSLEKIWVDRTIHIVAFRRFIGKLNEEWQDFIIVATVLLNANMAFLSIQSVDNGGFTVMNRSAAQIVSYISIVTSLGSALLSLLLLRQNRSKGRLSADVVAKFLGNVTCMTRGLENLAILYALPYALLMWSTLTFLVAFALDCFVRASVITRVPVGSVLALCISLVIRFFIAAWLCEFDRIRRLRDMRQRLRERALAVFGMVFGGSGDGGGDKQGGEDERKESGETATACGTAPTTLQDKRKHSRSSSWMPRIFVRGATVDDLNLSTMAPHVETNEEV